MGNLFCRSKKTVVDHRRIYVGDVPEIEETGDPNNPFQSVVDTTPELRPVESVDHQGRPVQGSITRRRTSVSSKKYQKVVKGKTPNYASNIIISSRYTILTFLPKNLFNQFRRLVNIYFLFMVILQFSFRGPVSPVTTAMPLIFVIIVTATKQGYEDWLRHRADNLVNNRMIKLIKNGKIVTVRAKDIVVGDIIKLEAEEQVPADIMVVGSSDDFLRCQLTTANLDGETNLKTRYCPPGLPLLRHEEDFHKLHIIIETEKPNSDLYVFNGSILIPADRLIRESTEPSSVHLENEPNGTTRLSGEISEQRRTSDGPTFEGQNKKKPKGLTTISPVTPESPASPASRTSQTSQGGFQQATTNFYQITVGMDNMALRGTKVKNTDFIYGVVVYTGLDTRLALNSKITHTKFSTVEKSINKYLGLFIMVLVVLVLFNTGMHFAYYWRPYLYPAADKVWYLHPAEEIGVYYVFELVSNFLVLFNYIIPISLYVTLELLKFIGSKFFVWDLDMRCPITKIAPLCNTSDLNEELGQIQYLFTDKTGTLTENVMEFRHCSINGIRYDMKEDNELYIVDDAQGINDLVVPKNSADISRFLVVLALCHTVQLTPYRRPSFDASAGFSLTKQKVTAKMKAASSLYTLGDEEKPNLPGLGNMEYQASSPDEKALLEACCQLGVIYLGERDDILTLEIFGTVQTFKRHYVLEFDPNRKCMSVIVEDISKGQFWLLSKGAENTILHRSESGPIQGTLKHIIDFALMGMRTLAVAERKLTKAEVKSFSVQVNAARRLLKGREEQMREVYRSLESNLHVLGATGVEDQLQEGVAETLQAFGAAGIRVWMLTGDKVETAVNVAISCGLVTPATKQLFATDHSNVDAVVARMKELAEDTVPGDNTTVIIDGETMAIAFKACPDMLKRVVLDAFRVVCCRMSPLQKAQMVNMVKTSPGNPITAAVGDGANDVAMIQEAHIGLGILGKEGRQAARCSDFAVARFSFLRKAILVHGHWYYVRVSNLALFFFYKNVIFILPQVFFCYSSGFSAQTLFDSYFLTMYNIFFSACPIFVYGLQEQSHQADKLMQNPSLYKKLSKNVTLSWLNFMWWHILAVYHAIVIFYMSQFFCDSVEKLDDWSSFGTAVYCALISVANMKMLEVTRFFTGWTLFSHLYSYITFFVFTSLYTEPDLRDIYVDPKLLRHTYYNVMTAPVFWLLMLIVVVTALTPDFAGRAILNGLPTIKKIYKRLSTVIPSVRLKKFRRKKFIMPTLLFSKRTGKLAISKSTLSSYLSRREQDL